MEPIRTKVYGSSGTNRIKMLIGDETELVNDYDIANWFNQYIVIITETIDSQLPESDESRLDYFNVDRPHSLCLRPVTVDECTSCNKNTLPVKIVILPKCFLASPLAQLMNNSIESWIFPADLRNGVRW